MTDTSEIFGYRVPRRGGLGDVPPAERLFGKEDGMADRLRHHVRILGTDKSLPWVGLGLCDDLLKAAEMIDGKPGKLPLAEARAEVFASLAGAPVGQRVPAVDVLTDKMEYDL